MKKRKIFLLIVLGIVLVIIMGLIYFIRTANIIMGFNSVYYRDIFNYPNSEWVCEDPKMELKVIDLRVTPIEGYGHVNTSVFALMHIEAMGEEKELVMTGGYGHVEIFDYDREIKESNNGWDFKIFQGHANYKKDFFSREIESFTIYDISEDEIFDFKYDKFKFHRK